MNPNIVADFKRTCCVEGCNNLGEKDKMKNGKVYRRRMCTTHKRKEYGQPNANDRKNKRVVLWKESQGNKCKLCGWVGPCDIHRLVPREKGGRYIDGNMILICPNCHRLEHYKKSKYAK